MRKKVFLHIGTFKTGTSAIQRFLSTHATELRRQGFFVPKGSLIGHHDLPLSLIKDYTSWRASWPEFKGTSAEIWQSVVKQIDGDSAPNVVISSENFCDLVNENARNASSRMGELLKEYLSSYDVFILAYLRPFDVYFDSMYRELVKVSPASLSRLAALRAAAERDSIHVRPSVFLDYFAGLFGRERVQVRRYDRGALRGGDAVTDMLDWLSIKWEGGPATRDVNPSLEGDAVNLKRIFNLAGIEGFQFNQRISRLLHDVTEILDGDAVAGDGEVAVGLLEKEADRLLNIYGVDVRRVDDTPGDGEYGSEAAEVGARVSLTDGFVIALLATTIRQNRGLLARLEALEKRLLEFCERD